MPGAGSVEIIVVVHQRYQAKLSGWIKQQQFAVPAQDMPRIEVIAVPEYEGSLAALLAARGRIRGDFLVVGCDLVTDAPLSRMADLHRARGALFTCMLSGPQACGLMAGAGPGGADVSADARYVASLAGEELLVALDLDTLATSTSAAGQSTSTCELIYCTPQADALDDATNAFLPVRMTTLYRHPRLRLRTDLLDPHCYLFGAGVFAVIDAIVARHGGAQGPAVPASLFSLREDVVPRIMAHVQRFHTCQLRDAAAERAPGSYAFIVDAGYYCLRANTLPALLEAGRQVLRAGAPGGARVAASAEVPARAQVGADALLGEGTRLGERSAVKRSVVGAACVIGCGVKLANSLVFDGAVIEDGCRLDGCIVGPRALVRERAQLRDCDVAPGAVVERDTSAKAEALGQHRALLDGIQ